MWNNFGGRSAFVRYHCALEPDHEIVNRCQNQKV